MCIFLGQKKYGLWRDFSEKFQVLCKNPVEVTRFDGTYLNDITVLNHYLGSYIYVGTSTLMSCSQFEIEYQLFVCQLIR
jgi:hypothetical protein